MSSPQRINSGRAIASVYGLWLRALHRYEHYGNQPNLADFRAWAVANLNATPRAADELAHILENVTNAGANFAIDGPRIPRNRLRRVPGIPPFGVNDPAAYAVNVYIQMSRIDRGRVETAPVMFRYRHYPTLEEVERDVQEWYDNNGEAWMRQSGDAENVAIELRGFLVRSLECLSC